MEMKKGVLYLWLVKKTSSSRKQIWKRQFRSRGSSALKRLQHRVNKTGGLGWVGKCIICTLQEQLVALIASSSLLSTNQGDALQLPVDLRPHTRLSLVVSLASVSFLVGVRAEPDASDQVPIIALRVLVDRAAVVGSLRVLLLTAATTRCTLVCLRSGGLRSEVDNREGLEWILGDGVLKLLLALGPGGTFNEEAVDASALGRHLEGLLNAAILASDNLLLDLSLRFDGIE